MRFEFIKRAVTTGLVYAICVYFLYLSLLVSAITGILVAGICLLDKKYMKETIQKRYRDGFLRFLEILLSYTAIPSDFLHAFSKALLEFKRIYQKDYMLTLVDNVYSKTVANMSTDSILQSFAEHLDIEEAYLFCDSIIICEKKGADLNRTIKETIAFIKEKRSIEQEIEVITEEKKTERFIVSLCPFLILALFNTMGTGYLDILYEGLLGRAIMTAAGILFLISSYLAKKILEVKV
ncbi:MAG TPA: hypothetical protein PLZ28_03660 [Clostridia bacterium]|nr:hypothetical protein [Clostridia bacterium]